MASHNNNARLPSGVLAVFLAGLMAFVLSGCVSTVPVESEPQRDYKKAVQTHVDAGLAYLRQRNKDDAKRHFLKALEFDGNSSGAHTGIALVYQLEEEPVLAEKHFKKAITIDPSNSSARNNYAAFLYSEGQYQKALSQYQKVAEDFNYQRREIALFNMGRCYRRLGQPDEALESLRQAIGIRFRLPLAQLEMAELYFDGQEFSKSQYYLNQFSKMSRHNARSLWLGIQLERQFGNQDKLASYVLSLKNRFPYSEQYLLYKESMKGTVSF